jgi:hypothetical protein
MKLNQLREFVKQVVREEQDYQQLFKHMLDKYGKSITDMSDDEKKKFFNAVDTAYKAKSEGRLTGYNEAELTAGQKKIDVDGDGEIEGSDLAKLRAQNESINEIEYKDALEKFNADLYKNSQVASIAKHHNRPVKDVVKALQPYIKVLRYSDKSIKLISIDYRETTSNVKVHVSQTYQKSE